MESTDIDFIYSKFR